jgi:1,4-alpha-glucan branching enzyme
MTKPFSVAGIPPDDLNTFLSGAHSDPFRILGPHRMGDDLAIRAFRPDARKIDIVTNGDTPIEAEKIHRD